MSVLLLKIIGDEVDWKNKMQCNIQLFDYVSSMPNKKEIQWIVLCKVMKHK